MECPHCHRTLPSMTCSACGAETPEDSQYCFKCGRPVVREKEEQEGEGFSERIVCSDGTCIGIINERGVCNICGKSYPGDPS
jgi:predicted amidophosphoribosyltransferase